MDEILPLVYDELRRIAARKLTSFFFDWISCVEGPWVFGPLGR